MTHIYVSKLNIIGSDNGLSPDWHQANIFTNAGILLIRNAGTNFREILSEIHTFSLRENAFENIVYAIAAILSRPRCVKDRGPYHTRLLLIHGENKALKYFFKSPGMSKIPLFPCLENPKNLLNIEKSRKVIECIWLKKRSRVKSFGNISVFLLPVSVFVPVWLCQPIYLITHTKHAVSHTWSQYVDSVLTQQGS